MDTLRELGDDGSLVDPTTLIKELGWQVGQTCRPKKDHKVSGIITEITKDAIKVDLGHGVIQKVPAEDFESGQWVRFTPKAAASTLDVEVKWLPQNSHELHIMAMKGKIMQELLELTKQYTENMDSLHVQIKPGKTCKAGKKIAKGKLTLIPATLRVHAQAGKQKQEPCIVETEMKDVMFWLSPTINMPDPDDDTKEAFIAPFWFVKSHHHTPLCNMNIVKVNIDGSKIKFPALRNSCQLTDQTELVFFKDKASTADAEGSAHVQGKKRQKTLHE